MSTNNSTTTLYIDPPFSPHLRKLDNRVEQVELYGGELESECIWEFGAQ